MYFLSPFDPYNSLFLSKNVQLSSGFNDSFFLEHGVFFCCSSSLFLLHYTHFSKTSNNITHFLKALCLTWSVLLVSWISWILPDGLCAQMKYCPTIWIDVNFWYCESSFFSLLFLPGFTRVEVTNPLYNNFFSWFQCMQMGLDCPARMTDVSEAGRQGSLL